VVEDKKVELVSGAGDWPSLRAAIDAGCDSLFFGLKDFNLRDNASNFDLLELEKIIKLLHRNKRKAYLVLNTIIYNHELKKLEKYLKEAKRAKVDGVVLWDLAALELASRLGLKIHLSTQASVANYLSLRKYFDWGVRRVVLARECGLSDIREIKEEIKKEDFSCQIEAFAHGAMCVSVSGRCFLSEFSFGKSANRGKCLQVCRRNFKIIDIQDNQEYILGQDYILSPKDLCSVDFIGQLISAGVDALKIEGRRRSPEYIYLVTSVYRKAIDAFYQNKLDDAYKVKLKEELRKTYNRGLSSGFYFGQPREWQSSQLQNKYEKVYLGRVFKFYKKIMVAELEIKHKMLKKGDVLLFIGKVTGAKFAKAEQIQINHQFIDSVSPGQKCGIKLDIEAKSGDKVFLWKPKKK